MGEQITDKLREWFETHRDALEDDGFPIDQLIAIADEIDQRAEDECSYARTQVHNDYDGWIAPDELAEYYVPLPLDDEEMPIHDVALVMPDGTVVG